MKYSASTYAKMLLALTEGKPEKEIHVSVSQFLKLLLKQNSLSLLPRILPLFTEYWNSAHETVDGTVTSNRPLSSEELKKLQALVPGKSIELKNIIDKKLLGGISLRIGNRIYDASIRGKIETLKAAIYV